MANEQNLIPLNERSQRERKEISHKGAIASNNAKREKRLLKQQFEMLMELGLNEDGLKQKIMSLGITENETTIQMGLCVSMVQQALNGDIKAFEIIRDILGENPKNNVETKELNTIIFVNDIQDLSLENSNS